MSCTWAFGVSTRADSPGTECAHAHDEPALRDEQRELPLVQPRHVEIGVAAEPELAAAVIDFGTPVAAHPEVVTRRDRIIEPDGNPFVCAIFRREKDVAGRFGDAPDAGRQFIV